MGQVSAEENIIVKCFVEKLKWVKYNRKWLWNLKLAGT